MTQSRRKLLAFVAGATIFLALGCSRSASSPEGSSATAPDRGSAKATGAESPKAIDLASIDQNDPRAVVAAFLDAIRRGDDQAILTMYTERARQQAATLGQHFAPKGSDTARFTVGEVEYLADDGARVACTWTDLDENGQPHTDKALWMVRRQPEGWRVAGMAVKVFDGEQYLLLDFEDLERTQKELEAFQEEQLRRIQQEEVPRTATTADGQASPLQ